MIDLKKGTKVRIKTEKELRDLLNRDYIYDKDLSDNTYEWKKHTDTGAIIFLSGMFKQCGKECTIDSKSGRLGYYMKEIPCYWNPEWFDVIEESRIKVGDTIVLKSLVEVAKDKEALKDIGMDKYTFGEITYEEMWEKQYNVEYMAGKGIGIRKTDGALIYIPEAWVSKTLSAEETYRKNIEKYVSEHDFSKCLPNEYAPYDWTIEIDKQHHFIRAYVNIDDFNFEVFKGLDGTFKVE